MAIDLFNLACVTMTTTHTHPRAIYGVVVIAKHIEVRALSDGNLP